MRHRVPFPCLAAALALGAARLAAQTPEQALQNAAADYRGRLREAGDELNRTRARISAEKLPLLAAMRAAQDRVIAAESEATRIETQHEDVTERRRQLFSDLDAMLKTSSYAATLAHDSLKAATDGLAPGEDQFVGERMRELQHQLDDAPAGARSRTALDVAEFLLARTTQALGGYRAEGRATLAATNEVLPGMFAFAGPQTFFRPASGGPGLVRPREGAKYPISYALPQWHAADADPFFAGQPGLIAADATGGKALRLRETTGTAWQHVKKGGVVALAILVVGLLAVVLIVLKIRDLAQMAVDDAAAVDAVLRLVARGAWAEAEAAAQRLKRTTRDLFAVGFRQADQPASILEEHLQATLLEERLRAERRLPLLAVIATAAPLMGLLGTVVGMVKTFALITVFGTGNAGKLSSGISEVLVATELGLMVAIPTLVIHGFLAHRIQRNLSRLERHALRFATAAGMARAAAARDDKPEKAPLPV